MNRRQILKTTLLTPLLGLFKSRKSAIPDKCPCGCGMPNYLGLPATNREAYITKLKRRFSDRLMASETSGTSSDTKAMEFSCQPEEKWVTLEYDYENERVLMKPIPNEEFYKGNEE